MPESMTLTRLTAFPNIERIKVLSDAERAWMAGFFDGEGSVGLYRKLKNGMFYAVTTRINVSQTDRAALDKFYDVFGGALTLIDRPDRAVTKHTQYWTWSCDSTANANLFLQTVRPFLHVKGEEADIVMQFIDNRYSYTMEQKGALIDAIAALKLRAKSHVAADVATKLRARAAKIQSMMTGTDDI